MPSKPLTTPTPKPLEYRGKPPVAMTRGSRQRFLAWYDSIIDWILANPGKSMHDCGAQFNRTANTMGLITGSDVFRMRLAQRRTDLNLRLANSLVTASSSVALSAMEELQKRISDNPAKIPTMQLSQIADKALERLGYGMAPVNAGPQVTVNNTNVTVSPAALREAQQAMRRIHDINANEVASAPPPKELNYVNLPSETYPRESAAADIRTEWNGDSVPVSELDLSSPKISSH